MPHFRSVRKFNVLQMSLFALSRELHDSFLIGASLSCNGAEFTITPINFMIALKRYRSTVIDCIQYVVALIDWPLIDKTSSNTDFYERGKFR